MGISKINYLYFQSAPSLEIIIKRLQEYTGLELKTSLERDNVVIEALVDFQDLILKKSGNFCVRLIFVPKEYSSESMQERVERVYGKNTEEYKTIIEDLIKIFGSKIYKEINQPSNKDCIKVESEMLTLNYLEYAMLAVLVDLGGEFVKDKVEPQLSDWSRIKWQGEEWWKSLKNRNL